MSSRLQELDCCQRKLAEAEEMRTRDIQEQEEIAAEFEQMQQQVVLQFTWTESKPFTSCFKTIILGKGWIAL